MVLSIKHGTFAFCLATKKVEYKAPDLEKCIPKSLLNKRKRVGSSSLTTNKPIIAANIKECGAHHSKRENEAVYRGGLNPQKAKHHSSIYKNFMTREHNDVIDAPPLLILALALCHYIQPVNIRWCLIEISPEIIRALHNGELITCDRKLKSLWLNEILQHQLVLFGVCQDLTKDVAMLAWLKINQDSQD